MQRTETQRLRASCWVRLIKAAWRYSGRLFCLTTQQVLLYPFILSICSIDIQHMCVIMLYFCVLCCTYIQLFEDGVFFYSRKHDSHGVRPILQEGNLHSVHVVCQFLDVCLQLCEGFTEEDKRRLR